MILTKVCSVLLNPLHFLLKLFNHYKFENQQTWFAMDYINWGGNFLFIPCQVWGYILFLYLMSRPYLDCILSFRCGSRTFINIFNPRYLGSAITPGAVYIGSSHDNKAEVICFRGNSFSAGRETNGTNGAETFPIYSSVSKRDKWVPCQSVSPRSDTGVGLIVMA